MDEAQKETTEWLKTHSATTIYTPRGIVVTADIKIGKFVTNVSGMHKDDEMLAAQNLIDKAKRARQSIKRNQDKLEQQTIQMLREGLDSFTD
jgi:hypothetical protein